MAGKALTSNEAARLEQSFVVGLSRSPLPSVDGPSGRDDQGLAALALLGQWKRFRSLPAVAAMVDPLLPDDDRPILPDPARPVLKLILVGREASADDPIAIAAAHALGKRGLRYHPFDLPWLQKHFWHLNERGLLGATERAWFKRNQADAEELRHADHIGDENWTDFSKSEREAYLSARRRDDPDAARALLEACFAGERADVREALLRALQIGIGPGDRSFLEGLSSDRAKSVRQKAELLLQSIPGTPQHAASRDTALAKIEVKKGGLVSRKRRISFRGRMPAHEPKAKAQAAYLELEGLSLDDIASHCGCSVETLLPAAAGDFPLQSALLHIAADEGRWPLLLDLAGGKDGQWDDVLPPICGAILKHRPPDGADILRSAIARTGFESFDDPAPLELLNRALEGPLDPKAAQTLLAGRGWKSLKTSLGSDKPGRRDIEILCALAPLIPATQSERFLADIEPLPREIKLRPMLYHRFVAALDAQISSQE